MLNTIVHVDVLSQDLRETEGFFSKVFGWSFTRMDDTYMLFRTSADSGLSGGGFSTEDGGQKLVSYILVDDINAKLDEIRAAGGSTLLPKTALPEDYGFIATFADPHGVKWGLYSKT